MSIFHEYENISNATPNTESDFYASYFESSDTSPPAGDSGSSLQAPKYLEFGLTCYLLGGQLANITSIFVNREVLAFMARASGDEMLNTAVLDGDGIEPFGLNATGFGPWKVSKVKADAGGSLIFGPRVRSTYPTTAPIQSQYLDRDAVNDNHWGAAA